MRNKNLSIEEEAKCDVLKQLREQKKWSQQTVAENALIDGLWSHSEVSKLENGHTKLTDKMRQRLCEIYGITVQEFERLVNEQIKIIKERDALLGTKRSVVEVIPPPLELRQPPDPPERREPRQSPPDLAEEDLASPGELPGNLTYPRNLHFQGRKEVLHLLCEQLTGNGINASIQALPGMGGVGKTETAVEFAYRCFDKTTYPDYPTYNRILWSRADDVDALNNGYTAVARRLPDFPNRDEKDSNLLVQAVIRWLADPKHRGWLLVLDNADHPDIIHQFLPRFPDQRQGQVLLTSRSQIFAGDIHSIPVEPMPIGEAVAFLYDRTGRGKPEGDAEAQKAQEIVEELGGLPLALEQTAVYLQRHPTLWFADYLAAYRKRRSELLAFQTSGRPYQFYNSQTGNFEENLTVRTIWDLNFREIAARLPRSAELLTLTAALAPAPIPCELIYAAFPDDFARAESEEERAELYDRFLAPLLDFSLVKILRAERAFSVHVLVQSVLWEERGSEDQKQISERMLAAVAGSFPTEDYVLAARGALYYSHAEHLRHYVVEAGMEDGAVGRLLNHMGAFLFFRGRSVEAEPLLTRALEIREKVLPAGHPDIATSLNDLAVLYASQGRAVDAAPLFQQALLLREKALPAGHSDISKSRSHLVESLNNLATLHQAQHRFAEAERLYLEALERKRLWFHAGHSTIALGINNLATLYHSQRRLAEAEPLYQEVLKMTAQGLPKGHNHIAVSHNNLGVLYQDKGRSDTAEPHFLQALAIWRKLFPDGHPYIAKCATHLAKLYRSQGQFAEAVALLQEALSIWEKSLPVVHPTVEECRNDLAACRKAMDKPQDQSA